MKISYRATLGLGVAVGLWVLIAYVQGVGANPFSAATTAACNLGEWECDELIFKSGRYDFRCLFTDVRAELQAGVGAETLPIEIELRHTPIVGWRVKNLRVNRR